ncbi:MAG: DUF4097 domain-containing protein [[Eubacterium] siraeum]|nr:DUF4097 domain-containing protein [[Eubacterium] siraeum]
MEERSVTENVQESEKTAKAAVAARCLIIPAIMGFAALFAVNFVLILLAVVLVSVGLLTAAMGALYTLGAIRVVSDLAPSALICAGLCCLFLGIFSGLSEIKAAPFSARLFDRYAAAFKGEKWRRIYYRKKGKNYMWLCLAAALLALLGTAAAQLLWIRFMGFSSTVVKESIALPSAKYVTISTTGLNFQLKPYDGEEIVIEYVNDSPVIIEESDINYLKLVQDDSFTLSLFSLDQFNYNMTVWLPKNDYRDFYLDSGSGDIVLYETVADYTNIRTRSGSIDIKQATEKISASTVDGNINCSYIAFINAGTFETKSGKIKITVPDFSGVKLQYRTESGKLKSGLLGLEEDHYGSIDAEKKAELSRYLYVTTENGWLELEGYS